MAVPTLDCLVFLQQHLVPRLPRCRGVGAGRAETPKLEGQLNRKQLTACGLNFPQKAHNITVKNGTMNPNYKIIMFSPKLNTINVICSQALATIS